MSAESGVLTYKDSEDKVEVDGRLMSYEEVTNLEVMETNPFEFW